MQNKGYNFQLNETPVLSHYSFLLPLPSHTNKQPVMFIFTLFCRSYLQCSLPSSACASHTRSNLSFLYCSKAREPYCLLHSSDKHLPCPNGSSERWAGSSLLPGAVVSNSISQLRSRGGDFTDTGCTYGWEKEQAQTYRTRAQTQQWKLGCGKAMVLLSSPWMAPLTTMAQCTGRCVTFISRITTLLIFIMYNLWKRFLIYLPCSLQSTKNIKI